MPHPGSLLRTAAIFVLVSATCAPRAAAQTVDAQLQELRSAIEDLRTQLAEARREAADLRTQVQTMRADLAGVRGEDQSLVAAKVDDLEQTKVESGSKYHVRLSGLALLTASTTRGGVDNSDVPTAAEPAAVGSIAGSARQSWVRVDMFGPTIGGARTTAEATFDFFGGFPSSAEGLASGLARLRTSTLALDWTRTRIVAGQDAPFFSPLSPTSLVSSAYPAMSSAGNMWSWAPQVHVDRRVGAFVVQGGVLDPFTGELPANEYEREPTAGERTRVPATAARIGVEHGADRTRLAAGAGAYYSRQTWSGQDVHAWAATGDWLVPIGSRVSISGEAYHGRAIAGLGGGAAPSVLVLPGPGGAIFPVTNTGGWSQLSVAASSRLTFNAAIGTDRGTPAALPVALQPLIDRAVVGHNTTGFLNGIYQVRSNLLFSIEYRRLQTLLMNGGAASADHVTIGAAVGF